MTAGIYLITHTVTGDRYVGRSHTIERRWKSHIAQLQKRKHHSKAMQALADEYGINSFSFEILEVCEPLPGRRFDDVLSDTEQKWIEQLGPELNIKGTERMSELHRKRWTPELRKLHGEKIRAIWKEISRKRRERRERDKD